MHYLLRGSTLIELTLQLGLLLYKVSIPERRSREPSEEKGRRCNSTAVTTRPAGAARSGSDHSGAPREIEEHYRFIFIHPLFSCQLGPPGPQLHPSIPASRHLCLIFTGGYLIPGKLCSFFLHFLSPPAVFTDIHSQGGGRGEMPYKSGRGHPGYKSPLMKFLLKDTDGYNPLSPITFNGGHISAAVAPRLTSLCGRSCRIPEASVDARQTLPPPPSSPARSMTIDVEPDPDGFGFFFPAEGKTKQNSEVERFH